MTQPLAELEPGAAPAALLGIGTVRHERLRPRPHRFAYPTYFVLLPMRRLRATGWQGEALAHNRFAPMAFHDRDHGDGRHDAVEWADDLLQSAGVLDATGELWLHCYPRVLGFAFKPVSFWYAHRTDGSLAAVIAEVNNTFGERHCYLLNGPDLGFGRTAQASKVFHVSPFCEVRGSYLFRFMRTDLAPRPPADGDDRVPRTVVRIDHADADGPLLRTSVSGSLSPATRVAIRLALVDMPLMTLFVVARIHWQALQLWWKRVPFVRKPAPPELFVTR
jgi:uncharacterized protein